MAVITINPLEILDGDDVTVIDLEALAAPGTDPHALLDALEAVQPLSHTAARRILALADEHPEISYTALDEDGAPTGRAFSHRLELINAYRPGSDRITGAPALGVDGRRLLLRASHMRAPTVQLPF